MIAVSGAATERTRLAWRRTALSGMVVALLACRPAIRPDAGGAERTVAALAVACWALMVGLGHRRQRGLRMHPYRPIGRTIRAFVLLTALLAGVGGWVVML